MYFCLGKMLNTQVLFLCHVIVTDWVKDFSTSSTTVSKHRCVCDVNGSNTKDGKVALKAPTGHDVTNPQETQFQIHGFHAVTNTDFTFGEKGALSDREWDIWTGDALIQLVLCVCRSLFSLLITCNKQVRRRDPKRLLKRHTPKRKKKESKTIRNQDEKQSEISSLTAELENLSNNNAGSPHNAARDVARY